MDNDYDDDGNNIVPCPICMSKYCPSKEDGKCPGEDMFALEGEIRMLLSEYKETGDNSRIANVLEAVEHLLTNKDQELQQAREEERDKILRNILKWSDTATVMETTGKEGAKRATKKLREHLYGSYHFLYQALRIDQSELDQPIIHVCSPDSGWCQSGHSSGSEGRGGSY